MCMIHSASLVSEYLYILENKPYLPTGAITFQEITGNCEEEAGNLVITSSDGIAETISDEYISEEGIINLLNKAAHYFMIVS